MTNQHLITPPPELVQQWWEDFNGAFYEFEAITTKVFQAAADQELEACCEWLIGWDTCEGERLASLLHEGRRPEPPSLKEQAYIAVDRIERSGYPTDDLYIIRRALEQLDD